MTTRTATETTSVGTLTSVGMRASVSTNFWMVPPPTPVIPSMPPTSPSATWTPTPVRKPTRTLRDRKLATKPSRRRRATIRSRPHSSAASDASSTYCGEPTAASPARPVAMMAAVAESAPTTRWRDDPRTANATTGRSSVYRPVMTGVPAILV